LIMLGRAIISPLLPFGAYAGKAIVLDFKLQLIRTIGDRPHFG
jgi:hypothetical protein